MSDQLTGQVSHYRIVGPLGQGGMGAVYRAHDDRLGRDLALKVLLADSTDDATARSRLVREARMASSLAHPNITHVYEVGEHDGRVFIAMELVEGRTLQQSIPPGGLAADTVLRIGVQIADALAYAHQHGVIHRDLKSSNVMLTPAQHVKVLDFGIAKRLPQTGALDATSELDLTTVGTVMGTPNHLPPEVLLGATADARGDVWALGVVLYQMAAGRLPFDAASLPALANAITGQEPAPLGAGVPAGLRAVITRCLAKQPERRYQRGGEVRVALEALGRARAPAGAGAGLRRAALPLAGVALLAIAAAVVFAPGGLRERLAQAPARPRIRSLAVLPLANLSGDPAQEYFADGMTEELITDLAPIPSLKVISRTSVMRFKGSQQPLREIAKALGVDAVVEGSVLRAGDRVRITAQLIEAASDHHLWARSFERDFRDILTLQSEVARDIAQEIQLQVSPRVSENLASHRAVNPQAYEEYLQGRFQGNMVTDAGVRASIAHFERALALDPGDARYGSALADAYLVLTQLLERLPTHEGMVKVEQYARQALDADEHSAEAHTSMGAALFFGDWDWAEGERHLLRAIELNPGYAEAHLLHSILLAAAGRAEESIQESRRALELDPLSIIAHWNAISTLYLGHRYDEALAEAQRAAETAPDSRLIFGSILRIHEQRGEYKAALELLESHLAEADGGRQRVDALRRAYRESGPTGYWRTVLAVLRDRSRTDPIHHERLATTLARLGDREGALDALEHAFAERSGDVLFIKVEPAYESLRDDPRFQALVRRVGLP